MTKQEIIEYFSDINHMYNNPHKLGALSEMIDELLANNKPKEYKPTPVTVDYGRGWYRFVCGKCGLTINLDDYYCRHCGMPIQKDQEDNNGE